MQETSDSPSGAFTVPTSIDVSPFVPSYRHDKLTIVASKFTISSRWKESRPTCMHVIDGTDPHSPAILLEYI